MISVIIPCFNDGHYLSDAVNSVKAYNSTEIEIIIVNDGSTDSSTLITLDEYQAQGINVISQTNKGLSHARNRGIDEARGEFILPLDADNKIKPAYINKGLELLQTGLYDIIYANPLFFGEDIPERKFETREFNGISLLYNNYIDACAIFRKSTWNSAGGYATDMPYQGYEDWDLWLNCYFKGFRFKHINESLYYYRISENSMISKAGSNKFEETQNYLFLKYKHKIITEVNRASVYENFYLNDQKKPLRSSLKYLVKFLKNGF